MIRLHRILKTHLVEIRATPLCSMLACMPIEDCEESLPPDRVEVYNKRVSILHRPPRPLALADPNLVRCVFRGMSVQNLRDRLAVSIRSPRSIRQIAHPMGIQVGGRYRF